MTTIMDKEKENEKNEIVKHQGTRTSGGQIQRLMPQTLAELERLAVILADSDIVPKDMVKKPANVLLALMFGNEIGLTPAQALQNIMVVNGRPTLWGDATMGLVLASDVYEDSRDSFDEATMTATFEVKRRGKDWLKRTFSQRDAETAKLWKKEGPWQNYPRRMLFHRARSWALRDAFPDVLKGIRYYEEEKDIINAEVIKPGKTYDLPKERATDAPPSAPAQEQAAPAAAAETSEQPAIHEATFKVSRGGGTTLDEAEVWVVSDDAETPNKYYTDQKDFFDMAKTAKDAKVFLTANWIDKAFKKGPVRWLTGLSLKS